MAIVTSYREDHFEGVQALWLEVFPNDPPWNRAELAIPEKLAFQPELFLVAEQSGRVIGTAMAGYDGHRGWLYTVAVRPSHQGRGIGSLLVEEAEKRLHALGCRKINLQVRASNADVAQFYSQRGYVIEERVSMGKRLTSEGEAGKPS
jgi:ribosomal protein S18 acetylase RimI-like enzyme